MSLRGITRPVDPVSTNTGTLGPPFTEMSTTGSVVWYTCIDTPPVPSGGPGLPAGPVAAEQPAGEASGPTS